MQLHVLLIKLKKYEPKKVELTFLYVKIYFCNLITVEVVLVFSFKSYYSNDFHNNSQFN